MIDSMDFFFSEDAYCSGLSSAGNTPRLSESMSKGEKEASTFFLQESLTSPHHLKALLGDASRQVRSSADGGLPEGSSRPTTRSKPSSAMATNPNRALNGEVQHGHAHSRTTDASNQQHQTQQHRYQRPQQTKQQYPPQKHHYSENDSPGSYHQRQHQNPNPEMSRNNTNPPKDIITDTTNTTSKPDNIERHHGNGPPPYNMVMKSRRRPAEGASTPNESQSQQSNQSSLLANHQNQHLKPHAHAAVLKHGVDNGSQGVQTKATSAHGIHNIQALPDFHDKNSWRSSSQQHTGSDRGQRQIKPVLKSQRSWANTQRLEPQPTNHDLASSYPLVRPRPSSATEIEQPTGQNQREDLLRLRSNSALGNKSRHGQSGHGNPVPSHYNHNNHRSNTTHMGQNYEHVKDSTNSTSIGENFANSKTLLLNSQQQNGSNLRRSPRREDLSKGCSSEALSNKEVEMSETQHKNQPCPRLVRGSKVDLSDPDSVTPDDAPPPLPPKGEYLLRRTSMGSQNSLESSGHGRPRMDSGSSSVSARGGSGRAGSGSRASVEIQDVADHQYLVYNPNLPVQDMLDHNQNFFKMESKNTSTNVSRQQSSNGLHSNNLGKDFLQLQMSVPHIPPLEFPDDLIAASDGDSPDDTFTKISTRLPSDSTTSSLLSDRKPKAPSLTSLNGSRSNLTNLKSTSHLMVTTQAGFDASHSSTSSDKYPDDIYIDVPECDVDSSGSAASLLKVLPVEDKSKGKKG